MQHRGNSERLSGSTSHRGVIFLPEGVTYVVIGGILCDDFRETIVENGCPLHSVYLVIDRLPYLERSRTSTHRSFVLEP